MSATDTSSYEVVVSIAGRKMFQEAFYSYMCGLGFAQLGVGGRLGRQSSYDFRSDDGIVSLGISAEGQSHFRMVVHSQTIAVEPLVLDALTEGAANILQPFCESFSGTVGGETLRRLITELRDSFEEEITRVG
jgi:hypothetical protein